MFVQQPTEECYEELDSMKTVDLDPKDYKYIVQNPGSEFSPERNKAVVNQTISETETYFRKLHEVLDNGLGERIDILASYGTYRFNKGEKSFKDYAGKQLYTRLIGEKILEKVKIMEATNRLNNNKKFKNTILL